MKTLSVAIPMARAAVNTTRRGRRYVVCPGCTALSAPVPPGATRLTCSHCGVDIELTAKASRKADA